MFSIAAMFNILPLETIEALFVFALPYILEAVYLGYQMSKHNESELKEEEVEMQEMTGLKESLLGQNVPVKKVGIFERIENWCYKMVDEEFMPEFCNGSMKKGALNHSSAQH